LFLFATALITYSCALAAADVPATQSILIENANIRWEIGSNGRNLHFIGKQTGQDYLATRSASAIASVTRGGHVFNATSVTMRGNLLSITFGESGFSANLTVQKENGWITLEVASISGPPVDELAFLNIPLMLKGSLDEPFAACALPLNIHTRTNQEPGPSNHCQALCYAKFGLQGAKVAVIACPQPSLRQMMKDVVSSSPDIPHNTIGGPWAMDADINFGDYTMRTANIPEAEVDSWIDLLKSFGMNEVMYMPCVNYGDLRVNSQTYPGGAQAVAGINERFHAAGIATGMHTYSVMIDKGSPYVTPVPDSRLGKDAVFTLVEPLSADSTVVTSQAVSPETWNATGFILQQFVTLRIDDELISYSRVTGGKDGQPYVFSGCKRGAYGTRVSSHASGTAMSHVTEYAGQFLPDPDSTLLTELADQTADILNSCKFDMVYLDAFEGAYLLNGRGNAWYYGGKFVEEICKRLDHPVSIDGDFFTEQMWYARSRMGTRDYPNRDFKGFVDAHVATNIATQKYFMPCQMGWWSAATFYDTQTDSQFPDDVEYLMSKTLAYGYGFSLNVIVPSYIQKFPIFTRLAPIFREYLELGRSKAVPQSVLDQLKVPGDDFTLSRSGDAWKFFRMKYLSHVVQGWDNSWTAENKFEAQPAKFRIQALTSGSGDLGDAITVDDFTKPDVYKPAANDKVSLELVSSTNHARPDGSLSVRLSGEAPAGSKPDVQSTLSRTFAPALNLTGHEALAIWVYGDNQGEKLLIGLGNAPSAISSYHYITIDFEGWRRFVLVEPEGKLSGQFKYNTRVNAVGSLFLGYYGLPAGKKAVCYLGPITALLNETTGLSNPRITVGGKTISFPVHMSAGDYLEFMSDSNCKLYDRLGKLLSRVQPSGNVPTLENGANTITFNCEHAPGDYPRAKVTMIESGGLVQ
jgi:hypothetical protein